MNHILYAGAGGFGALNLLILVGLIIVFYYAIKKVKKLKQELNDRVPVATK